MKLIILLLAGLMACSPEPDNQPAGGTRFDCPRCDSVARCPGCLNGNEDSWGTRK